jgi:hypothetical protein
MAVQLAPEIPEVVAKSFAPEVPEVVAEAVQLAPELGAIQRGTNLHTVNNLWDCHTSTNIALFEAETSEQALEQSPAVERPPVQPEAHMQSLALLRGMDIPVSHRNNASLQLSTTSQHAPYIPHDAKLRRAISHAHARSNDDSRVQQSGASLPYVHLDALRHVSYADQPLPELSFPELLFPFPLPLHKQLTRNSQL